MFGSAGKSPAVNGGMRGGFRGGDDEEDEDEEGGASFRKEAISLDQVSTPWILWQGLDEFPQARRIATQSVFRAGRF